MQIRGLITVSFRLRLDVRHVHYNDGITDELDQRGIPLDRLKTQMQDHDNIV